MNDQKIINYIIKPNKPFAIQRNCPGCLGKSIYKSTDKFRVNANGNRLDVWLIYQCESCKHTYNLPIYERKRPEEIPSEEYQGFMDNSSPLSLQFGTTLGLFTTAHAVIDWNSCTYELQKIGVYTGVEHMFSTGENTIQIDNPSHLKVRMDKILAQILNCSRSKISQAIKKGLIQMETSGSLCTIKLEGTTAEPNAATPLKEVC